MSACVSIPHSCGVDRTQAKSSIKENYMNRKLAIIIVLLIGILTVNVFAGTATANQTVTIQIPLLQAIAISAPAVTLGVSIAAAGDPIIASPTDSSTYIQWTCLNGAAARTIGVTLSANPPTGTTLDLAFAKVGGVTATAAGATGNLSSGPVYSCATGIASGNTGTGANGIRLSYSLAISDPAALVVANTPIIMTFTLSDSL
jgi:hypothetical protein